MKLFQFVILFFILGISACDSLVTEVSPDNLPDIQSKLVVQSFISPQASRTIVAVTESIPLFGESEAGTGAIKNALVRISDGVKKATIPFDTATNLYSITKEKFEIVAGKTYTLIVSDGKRTVTSTCKVPLKQTVAKTYVVDTTYSNNGFDQDTILTIKMTWQDIPVDTNYYRIRATVDLEYSIPDGTNAANFKEKRVTNRFNFRWDDTIGRNDFQSDANLDGAIFSSAIGRSTLPSVQIYDYGNGNRFVVYPKSKILAITFNIENTDATYFKYHRSLELSGNENPFSEPTLIYNNIEGGLGCFAAYNTGSVVYKP
ncbi:DUF4249 domain-containing protein [Dyadobacter sp. NIV53]|uniref:DUF4249 domain-containing protein n=1 Tax=Dyadobacter sp. NIV53 TaxID=2861765 RepID=UPI001C880D8C|nr:DUF4249 domain-containing protein [Dyadobacter sp. NIV53]